MDAHCACETIAGDASTGINVLKIQTMLFGKEAWWSVKKWLLVM